MATTNSCLIEKTDNSMEVYDEIVPSSEDIDDDVIQSGRISINLGVNEEIPVLNEIVPDSEDDRDDERMDNLKQKLAIMNEQVQSKQSLIKSLYDCIVLYAVIGLQCD
ncbi:hypothetical protein Droror1_Dr00002475 [Drosera rotundifolia]